MAININRYVHITSGVGASTLVAQRQLIGRLFTTNPLVPPLSVVSFNTALAVGAYFGTSSEEYKRAVFYFSWISKNLTQPQTIQYARWTNVAVAPTIFGNVQSQSVGIWSPITAGSFGLTIGGVSHSFTGLNFSSVATLADVATVLQTAIAAQFTGSTVTFDSTRGSFDFVGGTTGTAGGVISVQEGTAGTHIANIIGWLTGSTLIIGNGQDLETPDASFLTSAEANNNFGSFLFLPTLTINQIIAVATANKNLNVRFMYVVPVTTANVTAYMGSTLPTIGGIGLILSDFANQYPEMIPMMIEAATDYTAPNSVENYEFQQFPGVSAGVTTDATANTYDADSINYYGQTQQAGVLIAFFQRGVLFGTVTDPLDMNVYANEQWLKDAAATAIMNLLLALTKVSANQQGVSQILATLQSVINQALINGTISVGKTLTPAQKMYITQITGDPNAWYQVQTIGYWVNCVIVPSQEFPGEYDAKYTLVYSKDDIIRFVDGTHVLI